MEQLNKTPQTQLQWRCPLTIDVDEYFLLQAIHHPHARTSHCRIEQQRYPESIHSISGNFPMAQRATLRGFDPIRRFHKFVRVRRKLAAISALSAISKMRTLHDSRKYTHSDCPILSEKLWACSALAVRLRVICAVAPFAVAFERAWKGSAVAKISCPVPFTQL